MLDDFARAAGALGANWQSPGLADAGTVTIAEQRPDQEQRRAPSSATWNGAPFGADQEAYLTVPTLPKAGDSCRWRAASAR